MFSYRLTISYKGTCYSGLQSQVNNPNTIQEHFERVIKNIINYQDFKLLSASRTDAGVHATGHVLKLELPKEISPENLKRGLNTKLPNDIRVLRCESIHPQFNPHVDQKGKEYHYYFASSDSPAAFLAETIYYLPEKFDMQLMQKACALYLGEHDFSSFYTPGSRNPNPIRSIEHASIEKTSFLPFESEVYYFKIKAKGFLKYQVRFMVGALLDIGQAKLDLSALEQSLKTGKNIGPSKAPPHGLHLMEIFY